MKVSGSLWPKYSLIERERRFLVDAATMPALDPAAARLIEDRYMPGTELRLRKVTVPGAAPIYKLGKKYPGTSLSTRPMTSIYLDAMEHEMLAALPAATLTKRRHDAGDGWVIDVFERALAGLVLAEVAAADDAALAAVAIPSWCAREVSDDPAYAGGALAIHGLAPEERTRVVRDEGDGR